MAPATKDQKLDTDSSGPEKIPAQGVCAAEDGVEHHLPLVWLHHGTIMPVEIGVDELFDCRMWPGDTGGGVLAVIAIDPNAPVANLSPDVECVFDVVLAIAD